MPLISYAQNFEDVLLWRALSGIDNGFYIDVGAGHPDVNSVSRSFHDAGWRGLDIEPVPELAHRLRLARPRDIVVEAAAGEHAARASLFVVPGSGLSTLHPELLDRRGADPPIAERTVEVTTLAGLCRTHAAPEIHFLRIAVEGSEAAVLAGADFARFRPWFVVVEATRPLCRLPVHADATPSWEPALLSAGYRFLWFDGLNRFYAAGERAAEMAPYFTVPPNVFDDFVRASDADITRHLVEAETRGRLLHARALEAEARADSARQAAEDMRSVAQRRGFELERARTVRTEMVVAEGEHRAAVALLEDRAREAARLVGVMRASTSWRVTAPLRRIVATARGERSRAERGERNAGAPPPLLPDEAGAVRPAAATMPLPRRARRTVHQFHSGSATGDAITNAMLLTRRLLRGLGYRSEIFVEHIDPALAHELRSFEELPRHDDYVLILRHSMGCSAFDDVAALAAPKVLLYHNITPPGLLASNPPLVHAAELGRRQLALLRPLVAAALADSEFSANELRARGFDPVRACPLLFDIEAMLSAAHLHDQSAREQAAQGPSAQGGDPARPFTVLFVGRVVESKAQADLVAAFGRFRPRLDRPSRLVLVGDTGSAGGEYMRLLHDRMREAGAESVLLAGQVSDAELHAWYRSADLYVSLSRHEGFGVPLVEAVAHGVPVLAWPGGAVPYTLGDAAQLLDDTAPEAVAARMLELARDPARRDAVTRQQHHSLRRFRLGEHLPRLVEAVTLAGAAPPEAADARAALAAQARFTVTGHINKNYSLAAINRELALAIEAERPGTVRIVPVEGAVTADLTGVPPRLADRVAALAARGPHPTGPHIVISQHYPLWVPPDEPDTVTVDTVTAGVARADAALALFFWEESLVPPDTVAALNRGFRGVLAPSAFVAKALIDSGVSIPVRTVGHAPDLARFRALASRRTARTRSDAPFTFLHVSSGFPRKGVDVLLAAYARAFRRADWVRLVVKSFPNPHNDLAARIAELRARDPDIAEIMLLDRDVDEAELLDLYAAADALVAPSRGEGFNLPAAEAMAAGVPLIVTRVGGHADFCTDANARLVDYRFACSVSHLATPHGVWLDPDPGDLAAALREAAAMRGSDGAQAAAWSERTRAAAADISAATDRGRFVGRVVEAAVGLLLDASGAAVPPPLRLAWVSSWNVRCGIAEYSRHLLGHFRSQSGESDLGEEQITVLADNRCPEPPTGAAPDDGPVRVVPAWRLGDAASMVRLARTLAGIDPHAVVIQHQPGLLGWGGLALLLTAAALDDRVVLVTLHNTRNLGQVAAAERAEVLAALARTSRVLVHTIADLNFLKGFGLVDNVTLLPHGALAPAGGSGDATLPERRPARALPRGAAPVIGSYGFFLPGKGLPQLIAAAAALRPAWPDLKLRLVNAAYDSKASAAEIAACRALAEQLGLASRIEWITAFLPHERSLALLAECDLVVLAYQASGEASSAALRTALGAGAPVAVTPLPLFDEAAEVAIRLPGTTAEQLAAGIAQALGDRALRRRMQDAARGWLAARDWSAVARRLRGMIAGLLASGGQGGA